MIKCECGAMFKTMCDHALHKVETGEIDKHRLSCSSCFYVLGTLQPDFDGCLVQTKGKTVFVYCKECTDALVALIDGE